MELPMKRILVPCDGSSESESILPHLVPLARRWGNEVALLHVAAPDQASATPPMVIGRRCSELRAEGVNAWMEVREGAPAEQILAWAREKGADLIAMSTHGRGGLRRVVAGSVAEAVLRAAEVPVLAVRPGVAPRQGSRILVALDGSALGEAVLRDAAALASNGAATLDLVRVALPVVQAGGLGEIPMLIPSEDPRPYLEKAAARLAAVGVEARAVPLEGRAATELLRYAGQSGAGLICMTTHGRTGLARLLMGSIAEEILRRADCPVWIRRPVPVPVSV
jgi:nucleotide-binding universal stress UspA family protein